MTMMSRLIAHINGINASASCALQHGNLLSIWLDGIFLLLIQARFCTFSPRMIMNEAMKVLVGETCLF